MSQGRDSIDAYSIRYTGKELPKYIGSLDVNQRVLYIVCILLSSYIRKSVVYVNAAVKFPLSFLKFHFWVLSIHI